MKTISEQLKDLGLKHGDMCEIEGHEERAIVLQEGRDLQAEMTHGLFVAHNNACKDTCGRAANSSTLTGATLSIHYTKVLPKPELAPLPEAVEKAIKDAFNLDPVEGWRVVLRAVIAECKKI